MNRNVESHFAELPGVDIRRSMFDRSAGHKTSGNVASLIPFWVEEVLPGDTFNVTTSMVVRLQTLLTPIYDNIYVDTYYFFVPNRLVWNHWKEFMGENSDSAWIPTAEYSVPQIESPEGGWNVGTIADYMGIPVNQPFTKDTGLTVSSLPFRAYALICNEWFRDENLSDPLNIPVGDADQEGSNGTNYITDVVNGGMPFKAAKYHDLFSSCLPSPQKHDPISFNFANTFYPVDFPILAPDAPEDHALAGKKGIWIDTADRPRAYLNEEKGINNIPLMQTWATSGEGNKSYFSFKNTGSNIANAPGTHVYNGVAADWSGTFSNIDAAPQNLYFDASDIQGQELDVEFGFNINELRLAFSLQRYYEKLARSGSRYREIILGQFGVHSPDARMMIPEYLGGHRFPLSIHQVENQSQGESDFLGDLGAMSCTTDVHSDFVKSFSEHGLCIGIMVARYDHSFPQGLAREWTRKDKFDYFWPTFANIGEMPIYKYEIDASVRDVDDEERLKVFGYNEAYASYRFKQNRVSSELRPGVTNSLAHWHLADYYSTTPSLSDSWVREDPANVDRVLAVTSAVSNQFFADIYVKNIATRPMPMYSVPGLIDHH